MVTTKLARRERQELMQRQEILAAAAEIFSENGIHNVSMHDIAKRAEFGIGTVYKFFANKDELFTALMFDTIQGFHTMVMEVLEQDKDPVEILNEYVSVAWRHHRKDFKLIRLFFPETDGPGFNPKAQSHKNICALFDQFIEKLSSVFERGIKEQIFREFDPYFMAMTAECLVRSSLKLAMKDPELLKSEESPFPVTDILLKGMLSHYDEMR
ncbi:MAG: TetR/AcrR family transcriptional regulator [Desulfomonile tiedjei]|uniref:TetR/AcrR family transcriptional regulator n=1 Tax=Desulfomonile tiedjei TaxID=2358 RepID=A0A9D6V5G1_9BACT|nr:TetR/AcrR family transcriptional regulator [Desulfomonile tiedjei]